MNGLSLSRGRVAKNTLMQVVSLGLETAAFAFAGITVARVLGPQGLGAFSPAWQLAVMLSSVALLGMDQRLIRELNRGSGRDAVGTTVWHGTGQSLLIGLAAAALPWVVGTPGDISRALVGTGVYVALSGPRLILRASLYARERMELETIAAAAEAATSLAAVGAALLTGAGPAGVVGALAAGRMVGLVIAWLLARGLWGRIPLALRLRDWPAAVRASVPLGVAFLFTTMALRLDIVFVGLLRPSHEAGIYGAAAVVTIAVPILVTTQNRSLFPVLSRAVDLDHPELGHVFTETWRLHIHLGLGAAAGLAALAGPLVALAYGPRFAASATVLAILAWLLPVRFLNNLCATTLNATAWRRREATVLLVVVGVNAASMLVLIPLMGYWGAVVGAAVTESLLLIGFAYTLRSLRPPIVRPLVEGAAIGLVVWLVATLMPGHVLLRLVAGGIAFVAAFVAVRPQLSASRLLSAATQAIGSPAHQIASGPTLRALRFGVLGTRPLYALFRIVWAPRMRRLKRLGLAIAQRHGDAVTAGPFAGMAYAPDAPDAAWVQRLVGSYEAELHGVVERCITRGYDDVVNIGAGEGYYAVGFARRLPAARVTAFELHASARRLCAAMASANRVSERVRIEGTCTPESLGAVVAPGALILCDCEGGEVELLDPDRLPTLRSCDILVELHDFLAPGTTELVTRRFESSHHIELIRFGQRDPSAYPALADLEPADRDLALFEPRPDGQLWAMLTHRADAGAGYTVLGEPSSTSP